MSILVSFIRHLPCIWLRARPSGHEYDRKQTCVLSKCLLNEYMRVSRWVKAIGFGGAFCPRGRYTYKQTASIQFAEDSNSRPHRWFGNTRRLVFLTYHTHILLLKSVSFDISRPVCRTGQGISTVRPPPPAAELLRGLDGNDRGLGVNHPTHSMDFQHAVLCVIKASWSKQVC